MQNKFLPIDVIKAGVTLPVSNINLDGYKPRNNNKHLLYKIIVADNGTKITLNYNKEYQWFSLKVSLPKLFSGTNARNLSVVCAGDLIQLVNKHLLEEEIYVDFSEFTVSLLEVSFNYVCETIEDKEKYIKYFSDKSISRKSKQVYGSSVVFKNKTSSTTIYNKSAEMEAKSGIPVTQPTLNRMLRVEHKLFKRGVKKHFKDRSVDNVLFSDHLEEIFLSENEKAGLNLKVLHKSLFYKILLCQLENRRNTYKQRVLKFYQELNRFGEKYVSERYSKNQIKSYKKIMESIGYGSTYISKSVHIIDFMNLEENRIRTNREERKMIVEKIKKERKTLIVKVKELLSLCLPCNFFRKVFGWFDTS